MPRILGVDIPKEKRIEIALCYFYGIGRFQSNKILQEFNIDPGKRAKDLSEEEFRAYHQSFAKELIGLKGICAGIYHRI